MDNIANKGRDDRVRRKEEWIKKIPPLWWTE